MTEGPRRRPSLRTRLRWALLAGALAGLILAALSATAASRYYPAYRDARNARSHLLRAEAILRQERLDASDAELGEAEHELDAAARAFASAQRRLDDPLIGAGRRLPILGGSLAAAVGITDIGQQGVQLGRNAIDVTRTYQRLRGAATGSAAERTEEIFHEIDPKMNAISQRTESIREQRERVTGAKAPPAMVAAVRQLDDDLAQVVELGQTYEDLSAFLLDFLGFNGPRTYLVLAQNNAELMPTGGLISVYGVLRVEDGRIQEKRFEDAVSYGGRWLERSGAYVAPPDPLRRYLLRDVSWNFAVSNWSPDFPTAAQEAERFFRLAGGPPVDGVIAINVETIEELLRVTGPVTVEPYGVTVTADNALDVIEQYTRMAEEPASDRKAFTGALAEELLGRLVSPAADQWTPLLNALERLRDQRQLLYFSHDVKRQALAQRLGLDGALAATDGDYFMLVDASVNSTKLNMVLQQQIDLAVQLDDDGSAHHQVNVSYHNDLPVWSQGRDPGLVRRLMLGGQYGGYVRLLTPQQSGLERLTLDGRETGAEEIGVEQGKAVFGRFIAVPSGKTLELGIRYTSNAVVRKENGFIEYKLHLQKQSGTEAIPVRVALTLPKGARLDSAELDGAAVESLTGIETDLAKDRELVVRYRARH